MEFNKEILKFVNWYKAYYEQVKGVPHPNLRHNQLVRVHDVLNSYVLENDIDIGYILNKWTRKEKHTKIKVYNPKETKNMNRSKRYDEDFKQSIVNLYHSGKSQLQLSKDYGVAPSTIGKWIKQYSEVQIDDETILTAKQIKELQKRNAALEEENLILKKAIAIFTPNSKNE